MPQNLDVHLLRAFVTIYETGSVTAAAERLFVTQPTVSYALARLREILEDPLFVRISGSMTPTPRAVDCYPPFSAALLHVENVLEQSKTFVPIESKRRFRIALSDIGELVFLPKMLIALQRQGPKMSLEVVDQVTQDDVPAWLASGKIDAAVGYLPHIVDKTNYAHLFDAHYVCVLRKAHPLLDAPLTAEALVCARHVLVHSEGSAHKEVEFALRAAGVQRDIGLKLPHFTALPLLVSQTDLIALVPDRVARIFQRFAPLEVAESPISLPRIEVLVHWDQQHAATDAQRWFIDLIRDSLSSI